MIRPAELIQRKRDGQELDGEELRELILAYARDEAFSFYYPENLDLLRHCGAELRPFSPLADSALPADTDAIYIGGGYPELYAARLAENRPLLQALRAAIAAAQAGLDV